MGPEASLTRPTVSTFSTEVGEIKESSQHHHKGRQLLLTWVKPGYIKQKMVLWGLGAFIFLSFFPLTPAPAARKQGEQLQGWSLLFFFPALTPFNSSRRDIYSPEKHLTGNKTIL